MLSVPSSSLELTDRLLQDASGQLSDDEQDPMRVIYLQRDLVCQSSLLALILRAIPGAQGSPTGALDSCAVVARDALNIHGQCMKDLRGCKNDPYMVAKYINWYVGCFFQWYSNL